MHIKRNTIPKTWPLERKGTKYLIRPEHGFSNGIPVLIVLREILQVVQNRKEAKRVLLEGKIKVNGKIIKEEKFPLTMFDVLSIEGKNLRMGFENKKFSFKEISGKEAEEKTVKVIGKKLLSGKRIQVNLSDGRNMITNEKITIGSSVVLGLKENKIRKIHETKKGGKIMVLKGKHLGKEGKIEEIEEDMATINFGEEKSKVKLENLIVIE